MTEISDEVYKEFLGQIGAEITQALAFVKPLIKGDQPAEFLILAEHLRKAKCIAEGLSGKED